MSVAPDGSPVALYLALSGAGEAEIIHRAIPSESSVLELGCGVGRVSQHLVAFGHSVTGVDNSVEMLAHASRLDGVEIVCAEIAGLDLSPRKWPVVVLASRMVNDENGPDFLAAAARHLLPSGVLLIERHEPGWIDTVQPATSQRAGVTSTLGELDHSRAGVVGATITYEVEGTSYRQQFVAYEVDDERLASMADTVGLQIRRHLDDRRTWVELRPAEARS